MRILAIDPGFGRVGIALLEKQMGKETLIHSQCLETSPKDSFPLRLKNISDTICAIIEKGKPNALAIETLFFNTNQKTVINVASARGVIIVEASKKNIPVYEYTPLQIKIAVTGYGRASKEQVGEMVQKLIFLEKKERIDDEMDAIAIGLTYFAHTKN